MPPTKQTHSRNKRHGLLSLLACTIGYKYILHLGRSQL